MFPLFCILQAMHITLYNSLTRTKEQFSPLTPQRVSLYVCGITPYSEAHIGHGRCYTSFDLLYRILRALEYDVTYVRNITDVDDKIIARATDTSPAGMATYVEPYITSFRHNLAALNTLPPQHEPTVSASMDDIITFISELIEKQHAYVSYGDVYFDRESFEAYGALSGRSVSDLLDGARIAPGEKKRSAGDFALWKSSPEGSFWQSPWGWGRPGWHIECSSFIRSAFHTPQADPQTTSFKSDSTNASGPAIQSGTNTIDIHGGGIDLLFPHHENEKAQSEALTGEPLARFWVHNAHVMIDKEKMSKSLGNSVILSQIFTHIPAQLLRFFFLQHHYRTPLDFTVERAREAERAYTKVAELTRHLGSDEKLITFTALRASNDPIIDELVESLLDDCNAPRAIGLILKHYVDIVSDKVRHDLVGGLVRDILGLVPAPHASEQEPTSTITPEIEELLAQRAAARAAKNWALADSLRDALIAQGYVIQDKKS